MFCTPITEDEKACVLGGLWAGWISCEIIKPTYLSIKKYLTK